MNQLRAYILVAAIFCLFSGGFLDASTGNTGVPIVIHRRIGAMRCELVQRGSLLSGKRFAWIEIDGTDGEIYSPELEPHDYLTAPSSIAGSLATEARRSGFELKTGPTTIPDSASVARLNGETNCPDLQVAIAEVEQRRAAKREQLQSKIYALGAPNITPASIVVTSDPKPDQSGASYQSQKDSGTGSNSAKRQGTVTIAVVIGTDGTLRQLHVTKSLDPDLDKRAMEIASRWIYEPATMKGLPVPTERTIQVSFHLY